MVDGEPRVKPGGNEKGVIFGLVGHHEGKVSVEIEVLGVSFYHLLVEVLEQG